MALEEGPQSRPLRVATRGGRACVASGQDGPLWTFEMDRVGRCSSLMCCTDMARLTAWARPACCVTPTCTSPSLSLASETGADHRTSFGDDDAVTRGPPHL